VGAEVGGCILRVVDFRGQRREESGKIAGY